MKTLYRQFIITTLLIMVFSSLVGFLLTNTYYHLVTKEFNDEKNVKMAEDIVRYIEETDSLDLERYLSKLGDIGYQFFVISESGYTHYFGGDFKKKYLPDVY